MRRPLFSRDPTSAGEPLIDVDDPPCAMDLIYHTEVQQIIQFQKSFYKHRDVLRQINQCTNPIFVLLYVLPFTTLIDKFLFSKLVLAGVLGQYTSTLLKWLFAEDRPFWWIQEHQFPSHMRMKLLQNDLTCEASPGSPSDHVTFITAVLFVLSNWILKKFSNSRWTFSKAFFGCIIWQFTFTIPMVVVIMAKLMSASNFLHQLIIGFLLGIFIGKSVATTETSSRCYNFSRWTRNRLILGMLLFDFAGYWIQRAMDIDPQWSVKMAFKWCDSVEYLKPEQIPTYALVQCFGIFVALTVSSPIRFPADGLWMRHRKLLGFPVVAAIVKAGHLMLNNVPREHGVWMFYLFSASTYGGLYFTLFNFDTARIGFGRKRREDEEEEE